MGVMHHHAIVVTSFSVAAVEEAHVKAAEIWPGVSPISPEAINGYTSFFVPPDGSKEGWEPSDRGNDQRQEFIEWMNAQAHEDGSNFLTWVEVGFGELGYKAERNDYQLYESKLRAAEDAEWSCQ